MNDLSLLQLTRCKGLVPVELAADSLGEATDAVDAAFHGFADQGWASSTPRGWRLTPSGREHAATLLQEERSGLDTGELARFYEAFCRVNSELKATVSAWQIRDGIPNEHADPDYDNQVLARLERLHDEAQPTLDRIMSLAPRLRHYPRRLQSALEKIKAGDISYVARPIIDSYHTVWFELHEDLIGLGGLTRADEAKAGRAQ